MNPSPQAVAAVRARVSDWTPDDAAIAAALNTPDRANPVPAGETPVRISLKAIVEAVPPARRASLLPLLPVVTPLIIAQDGTHIAAGLDGLVSLGAVQPADADAIKSVLAATEPDPSWPAQVSWAVATLGRPVDKDDIAASRPGA